MCGIAGYVGTQEASVALLRILRGLEYRGYDSEGVAIVSDKLRCFRTIGTFTTDQERELPPGKVGIGHTRWATHGSVNLANTHPHTDCSGKIAVVHNGIIDNYKMLKDKLEGNGHQFRSDTDTEVVAHLLETLPLREVVKYLVGTFALLVMREDSKTIEIARRDSPLIISKTEYGLEIASDRNALQSEWCYEVKDGEVLEIDVSSELPFTRFPVLYSFSNKLNENHYMLKEIKEQPEVLGRCAGIDPKPIIEAAEEIKQAHQVVFTASGTSRYASLIGRYIISRDTERLGETVVSSEFQYLAKTLRRGTVLVAISQSGETADVIHGVKLAKERGVFVIAIVNREGSMLTKLADINIVTLCGPEIGVAATKSFLGQLAIFYLIHGQLASKYQYSKNRLLELADSVQETVEMNYKLVQDIAHETRDQRDMYYIGRGINFAVSGESALKMKEVSYVHAEGMSAGELKHGTLSLISEGTPVFGICPDDYTREDTLRNLQEVRARKGLVIGISDKNDDVFDKWIRVPMVPELLYPAVCVVPTQLLAYWAAVERGLNADRPRALAKSVTVR